VVLWRRRRDQPPTPPGAARLHRPGADPIPLELVYVGQDSEGIHRWQAVLTPELAAIAGAHLEVGLLPARTSVTVTVRLTPDATAELRAHRPQDPGR
jgi:hypothetical protein